MNATAPICSQCYPGTCVHGWANAPSQTTIVLFRAPTYPYPRHAVDEWNRTIRQRVSELVARGREPKMPPPVRQPRRLPGAARLPCYRNGR